MDNYEFFWEAIKLCDWKKLGDDDKVLKPLITYLAKQEDSVIFTFDDTMTELLYSLDTKELMEQCEKVDEFVSDDTFLYSRCVALCYDAEYYEQALRGKHPEMWEYEFESLLYVPSRAWARKHKANEGDYPHDTPLCYETGSNEDGWK